MSLLIQNSLTLLMIECWFGRHYSTTYHPQIDSKWHQIWGCRNISSQRSFFPSVFVVPYQTNKKHIVPVGVCVRDNKNSSWTLTLSWDTESRGHAYNVHTGKNRVDRGADVRDVCSLWLDEQPFRLIKY